MFSLLEVLVTFVGVMLLLALAAQSLQEIIKVIFTVKSQTMVRAMRGLLMEAATSRGLLHSTGEDIVKAVTQRLGNLGQNGVRHGKLRLDDLSAATLAELITKVEPSSISGLSGLDPIQAQTNLEAIADQAAIWFPLSMDPVDKRYRRRMRGFALLSSAIVVLGLNANALDIFQRARTDSAYRAKVGALLSQRDSLDTVAHATLAATPQDSLQVVRAARDSVLAWATKGETIGTPGGWQLQKRNWWIGILLSILLVSQGAPFWHDVLESLFGLKNRIRAQAEKVEAETPSEKRPSVMPDSAGDNSRRDRGKG